MTTMFQATLELANKLGVLRVSTATGGTTGTLLDTKRTEGDDAYNGGTLWLITDVAGASGAPENEWPIVTDFANTGGVFTATFTVAPANLDTYGCATSRYPLDVLKSAINNEIIKHKIPRYDRTSLDIISGQSEYTLPVGIRGENLVNVYEETDTDTSDSKPVKLNFEVQEAATGSQHLLVIKSRNVTAGNDIMLEYTTYLSPLYLATDDIDDIVPMALILPAAAATCELISTRTYNSGSPLDIEMLKHYQREAIMAEQRHVIRLPSKRGSVNEV